MLVTFQAMTGKPVTSIQAKRSKGPSITVQGLNSSKQIPHGAIFNSKAPDHIIVRIKKKIKTCVAPINRNPDTCTPLSIKA